MQNEYLPVAEPELPDVVEERFYPQEIHGAVVCPGCNHANDIDSNFCGMCGGSLDSVW